MINYTSPIVVIAGPTASGKSSLAIKLAKEIDGYIINADCRQIYKELAIGTAQPIPDKIDGDIWYIDGIAHHLYGHISAKDSYNIYQYQKDVQKVLDSNPHQVPILVGGTGLYIDSIVYNYDIQSNTTNDCKYSREELNSMDLDSLQSLIPKDVLQNLNESDIKNPVRLIRTIERGSQPHTKGTPLDFTYFVLDIDQNTLQERVKERINEMFKMGLEEENKGLIDRGFTYDMQALRSIGYREFDKYFKGEFTLQELKQDIFIHTIQYAKRQNVWFKRNKEVIYVKPSLSSLLHFTLEL
ncbi:tRNA (adenosine(37)-N6)-dimethylallyltransferase MiaA [bacterium]|nr:tRNA (adenosine(37)-N6)-dimethylallyltransferase MiaA [bacterium]